MDPSPASPNSTPSASLDELGLTPGLLANLHKAGITTIAHLEEELKSPDVLAGKMSRCGPKDIKRMEQAIAAYRSSDAAQKKQTAQQSLDNSLGASERQKPPYPGWRVPGIPFLRVYLAIAVVSAWALAVLAGLLFHHFSGGIATAFQKQLVLFSLAFLAAVAVFILDKKSKAEIQGGLPFWKNASIVGPLAAAVAVYLTLWLTMPNPSNRTVHVYLTYYEDGKLWGGKPGSFVIHYRRANGPSQKEGLDGQVTLQDVDWETEKLIIDRITCVGWASDRERANEAVPWHYPIKFVGDIGEVNIKMVRVDPWKDALPRKEDVQPLINKHGLTEAKVRAVAPHNKHHVSLTIVNECDRPITLIAYDCIAVFRQPHEAIQNGEPMWERKDERDIQRSQRKTWANFDDFQSPSGWFALFVIYEDHLTGKISRQPLGIYNLFQIREPCIVLRNKHVGGVEFEVDEARSKLKE